MNLKQLEIPTHLSQGLHHLKSNSSTCIYVYESVSFVCAYYNLRSTVTSTNGRASLRMDQRGWWCS